MSSARGARRNGRTQTRSRGGLAWRTARRRRRRVLALVEDARAAVGDVARRIALGSTWEPSRPPPSNRAGSMMARTRIATPTRVRRRDRRRCSKSATARIPRTRWPVDSAAARGGGDGGDGRTARARRPPPGRWSCRARARARAAGGGVPTRAREALPREGDHPRGRNAPRARRRTQCATLKEPSSRGRTATLATIRDGRRWATIDLIAFTPCAERFGRARLKCVPPCTVSPRRAAGRFAVAARETLDAKVAAARAEARPAAVARATEAAAAADCLDRRATVRFVDPTKIDAIVGGRTRLSAKRVQERRALSCARFAAAAFAFAGSRTRERRERTRRRRRNRSSDDVGGGAVGGGGRRRAGASLGDGAPRRARRAGRRATRLESSATARARANRRVRCVARGTRLGRAACASTRPPGAARRRVRRVSRVGVRPSRRVGGVGARGRLARRIRSPRASSPRRSSSEGLPLPPRPCRGDADEDDGRRRRADVTRKPRLWSRRFPDANARRARSSRGAGAATDIADAADERRLRAGIRRGRG